MSKIIVTIIIGLAIALSGRTTVHRDLRVRPTVTATATLPPTEAPPVPHSADVVATTDSRPPQPACDGQLTWWVDQEMWLCLPHPTPAPLPYPYP